ncbi:uncharacterized protein NECHADRAFT_58342 [Fusarium vanettenii 77-13-4]|uniref:Uncharacterized protein n=1 Tax=Fusarium vanettenii (strain ATCC MYA-4622 / CBS 123669 / FGSC 9596 / NRRL 45880 / 77-13-4) TaxID=660122 RepID=C7Z4Q7_FUSV7|nr:uncharacterized protein NECHADRAFT_58342 [Fusarium vanettenii 77-13-4]EEU40964.1 hypothetical protein NECHADRAFT_58342 [Fusarium vanettenii 77-13-4]
MEPSPLVKAHDHVRAAGVAHQSSDTIVAITEHTQAAGEFASAARSTSSIEALRTLKLLEEHHRKIAEILKRPAETPSQPGDTDIDEKAQSDKGGVGVQDANAKKENRQESATSKKPGPPTQRRYAHREMSSSIASNLATARGIRSKYRGQPLAPSVSNDQAPGNVDAHSRGPKAKMQNIIEQTGKPAWVPPIPPPTRSESHGKSSSSPRPDTAPSIAAGDDGGYTRFYSTFGSLINKISAPLAFAGLPLIQEESTASERPESPETSPKRSHLKASPSKVLEPDLSKIYSKATMQALVRDGHGPNDSFYVVPTTGHTMSYANILSFAEKEKRRGASELVDGPDEDDDDFVDAREAPQQSPGVKRRIGRARTDKELNNIIEELHTENNSLKDMIDKLTKRLHAFEASAQTPAMALAESYRLRRPGSPIASPHLSKTGDEALRRKNQEMEEQLAAAMKQMERLEKDNRKMQKTLDKYREKWEVLKAGAKARREAQGAGDSLEDASAAAG